MCGIVGFVQQNLTADQWIETLQAMERCLQHRGPDDAGLWYDADAGVGLAHRRLSIVDLSAEGHQPMISADGRYVLSYNGEIYNYQNIHQTLIQKGYTFRGTSDTEVMLAAFVEWGVKPSVEQFVGMFAFALWDKEERVLYLCRDRMGEKPLYYGWKNGVFLFASELKALTKHPRWERCINRDALTLLLRHSYIPTPYSIYENIHKLEPGCLLTIHEGGLKSYQLPQSEPYWSVKESVERGKQNPFTGPEEEALKSLETLLKDVIAKQMIADVPLGAFLSGGIDSSLIVALMQAQSPRPVKTFTIGFEEEAYNEAPYAKAVANHLKTDHTELYVSPQQAMDVIPKLPHIYDEPFSDSSQIPTYLVSKLAREHVTVSLSGDAGDELFGGYNRYFWGQRIWGRLQYIPANLRKPIASAILSISPHAWARVFTILNPILPNSLKQRIPGYKMHRLADIVGVSSAEEMYRRLVSHWEDSSKVVIESSEPPTNLTRPEVRPHLTSFPEQMMFLDTITYLPNDILTKVDRASMSVSLESRIPFLDHHVVDFAWSLPLNMKIRNHQGKWILRQILYQYVPKELIERPKTGFGIPIDHWLRGPLRDWAEELLSPARLKREGLFETEPIQTRWQAHLNHEGNWHYWLWDILMFQSWLDQWK